MRPHWVYKVCQLD
jgi:hypothetical protein